MPPNLKYPAGQNGFVDIPESLAEADGLHHTQALSNDADEVHSDFFLHDIEQACADNTCQNTERLPDCSDDHLKASDDDDDHINHVRHFIKTMSSTVNDPSETSIDEKRLSDTLSHVGQHGYGIQAIALWLFDDANDRLVQPKGGWWHHPDFPSSEALIRLTDGSRSNYVPPMPVAPGVDIAGLLWLESSNETGARPLKNESFIQRVSSLNLMHSHSNTSLAQERKALPKSEALVWRNLRSLVEDPDTAKGPRMSLMEQAGFGQATGLTFDTGMSRGMVIYLANQDLDQHFVNGVANVSYLRQATQFIVASAAMSEVRRASVAHLKERQKVFGTFAGHGPSKEDKDSSSATMESDINKDKVHEETSCCPSIPPRAKVWFRKIGGGGNQIPPALSTRQCLWTVIGAFFGLLTLSGLNEYYHYLSDGDYVLLIGPFGALMTLQYGLTAAPASQPRNAIFGQAVAGAVSLAFTYIPEVILPTWLRRAVGPAIAIGVMVKCGVTHPPAGAHAVLYASGKYNFGFYALVVLSTVVSVLPATIVNNMSMKRQYPTYWGFGPTSLLPSPVSKLFVGGKKLPKV